MLLLHIQYVIYSMPFACSKYGSHLTTYQYIEILKILLTWRVVLVHRACPLCTKNMEDKLLLMSVLSSLKQNPKRRNMNLLLLSIAENTSSDAQNQEKCRWNSVFGSGLAFYGKISSTFSQNTAASHSWRGCIHRLQHNNRLIYWIEWSENDVLTVPGIMGRTWVVITEKYVV